MPSKDPVITGQIVLKTIGEVDLIVLDTGTVIIDKDGNIDAPITTTNLTTTGNTTLGDAAGDANIFNGTNQFNNTITVGVDDTGYDVKLFGATSGAYALWDESADSLLLVGGAKLNVQGTVTVGVDDTGYDVKFFGATASSYMLWDESADKLKIIGVLDNEDTGAGGASLGPIVKKQLQAGEAYTGTTAGLMVKNYGEATATVPSGEFTGLYVNLKGLHTDPGNNTSLISAHVHGSNTTVVHAGLWVYGDVTNGVKASGSTLTSFLDGSEATSITNLANLKSGTDEAVEASVAAPAGNTTHCMRILIDGSTVGYIPVYAAKTF